MASAQVQSKMSVNVALCGSIPRAHLVRAPCLERAIKSSSLTANNRCGNSCLTLADKTEPRQSVPINENMRPVLAERQPLAHVFEAPTWAVPAKGEARLEPVCETADRHRSIDLSTRSSFWIGRSPHCDVQLVHGTSSRRHAMLFHHANGGCYIVDCGSAHGTFVNGARISSPSNGGVVVPYKVRRGAMIRFGGPGAPCFVLKSFSFQLKEVIPDDDGEPDMGELVRRNTRLNALGKSAAATVRDHLKVALTDALMVTRKRSFDSLATSVTLDEDLDEPSAKRVRCESPPLSPEAPVLHLVTPDVVSRRVTFAVEPQVHYPTLISPEDSGDEASV